MAIKFEKVSYEYPSSTSEKVHAISEIDLSIESHNEFVALIGHTGSGKSTLVQHMNALLKPTEGRVSIFGVKVEKVKKKNKKVKLNHLRQKVGLVFQFPEYQLFESTVLDDIIFGPKNFKVSEEEAKKRAKEIIKLVGLDESYLPRSPFSLSGGEKKRVSIAGILAMEPDILVLDEPTSGLDPLGRDELLRLFKDINVKLNKSIILITHDMNIVNEYAKRVVVMKNSKIVFDGKPSDLFKKTDLHLINLELPEIIKVMKYLKEQIGLDIDIYKSNIDEAIKELSGL